MACRTLDRLLLRRKDTWPTAFIQQWNKIQGSRYYSSSTTIVDLRSDTLTVPTPKMRDAMKNAVVGDDVFGEDPTVNKLQEVGAAMFGKEAGLLFPTCTMANLSAVSVHCQGRFNEMILGQGSHLHLYEVAGMAQIAGVQGRCIPNLPDGSMDLSTIEASIRPLDDVHHPWTKLICLENTQNKCGGRVLSLDYMKSVKELANKHSIPVHLDGARVFNAAVASKVPVSEIAQHFDSVSTAFSKGLSCPLGSMLFGSEEFISMALRVRKALGGGMRQAGVMAAPMLLALEEMVDRLEEDHQKAAAIAQAVTAMGDNPVCSVYLPGVQSNIVMLNTTGKVAPNQFATRMEEVSEAEKQALGESICVRMLAFSETTVRYVTHINVCDEDVSKVQKKIQYVIEELSA